MATLPTTGVLGGASITNGDFQTHIEALRDKLSQQVGTDTPASYTISAGTITPATRDIGGVLIVDTESAASTDDLNTIATTNFEDGAHLYVYCANASREVVAKNSAGGTGQIVMNDGSDFTLDALDKWLLLRLDGTEWKEVLRHYGADNEARQAFNGIPLGLSGSKLTPHENLVITRPSAATVTITADRVVLRNATGFAKLFSTVNVTPDITASGAGGIDTGSESSSSWYHIWLIGQAGGTISAVFSTSTSAPTLPSGYTFYGYVGAVFNDSSSDFIEFEQKNRFVERERVNILSSGSATTYTSISLSSHAPSTALKCHGYAGVWDTGSATSFCYLSAFNTTPEPGSGFGSGGGSTNAWWFPYRALMTTAQTLYYKLGASTNRASIVVGGWEY